MSAANFVTNVPVFEGVQGRFYLVDGEKYSVYFPIAWAHEHITFYNEEEQELGTGPKKCGNCKKYGSIRGVFVGYCSNCLENYHDSGYWRGSLTAPPGSSITMLEESDMWSQYPYLSGVKKYSLGDEEEGVEAEDENHEEDSTDVDEDDDSTVVDEEDDDAMDIDEDHDDNALDVTDEAEMIAALVAAAEAAAEVEDGIMDDDGANVIINQAEEDEESNEEENEDEEANEYEEANIDDTFVINKVAEYTFEEMNGGLVCNIV